MNDKELLELSAKAAGVCGFMRENGIELSNPNYPEYSWRVWNPLINDSDALRLAADLLIDCEFTKTAAGAREFCYVEAYNDHSESRTSAVRRAIVRAAAAIGRSMP